MKRIKLPPTPETYMAICKTQLKRAFWGEYRDIEPVWVTNVLKSTFCDDLESLIDVTIDELEDSGFLQWTECGNMYNITEPLSIDSELKCLLAGYKELKKSQPTTKGQNNDV